VNALASSVFDRIAILLSGLCLVHCLLGTVLVASTAVAGDFLSHDLHVYGLLLALPLAVLGLWRGFRVHKRLYVMGLGVAGIAMLAASLLVSHAGRLEVVLSIAGVIVLATAHLINLRAIRG